jgi:tRNA (guanine26-N2/guanine27-N2)-dimethyltransferase
MDPKKNIKLKEGLASFYLPVDNVEQVPSKSMEVFYNKKMALNRDITTLALLAYKILYSPKYLSVVDSMAASGVGAIRLLLECEEIQKIYINDLNPVAILLIKKNLELNNLNEITHNIIVSNKDANFLFAEINQNYMLNPDDEIKPNVISIDPFGTPNLYLDSAFKAIKKSMSLICITATDSAVLFGIKPEVCFRKYLAKPLHNEYCKEIGTRILLHFIARIANVNKLGIIPLLSFYSQHFIRIICLSFKEVHEINKTFINYGYIIHCNKCGYRKAVNYDIINLRSECPNCNSQKYFDYAGPLWIGEIHQKRFIKTIIKLNQQLNLPNKKRLIKLFDIIQDEIEMPLSYYNVHKLSKNLKINSVPKIESIITSIRKEGYKASRTHFDFTSIKTNLDLQRLKELLVTNR